MSVRDPVRELLRDTPFARLQAVIDALPMPVTYLDRAHRCRFVNRAHSEWLGQHPSALRGKPLHETHGEGFYAALLPSLERALAGEVSVCQARMAQDGSGTRAVEVRCVPDEDEGVVAGIVLIIEDLTERAAFAGPQLPDAGRRQDEFLATLAHDLRNPLASIRNALQLLELAESDRALTASARSMIDRQLKQLVRLIDDLLDVSRITHGRFELHCEPVDLATILQRALETSRPLLETRQHHVHVVWPHEPLLVEGDPARLAQVFSNLLDNSAKYSEAGGQITIAAMREDGYAVVKVADTGIGIAPELLPYVFDMFTRTGSGNGQEGLGVGLTLARRLVELHGGSVGAESDGPGKGSVFSVRLALAPMGRDPTPGHARRRDTHADASQDEGMRVLVVDDNHDAAASLALLLDLHGHEVRTASDGVRALEIADSFRPEAVLLDIGMPRLDGYETARAIRARPWGRTVQLLAVTGWGEDEDRQRACDAGFDHHLTKPVDPHRLQKLLARQQK